ncbi:hypothetical protein [Acetobacter lovaniensis]|uniref:Uncharacterized protein n=1 Tax=Acetobacter lovaniensis TaxID=104100 RepID=A0A841QIE7_9PROT|nr:hypothetical protein [Acetobacter lovaniensis]MBB6457777.1 hypothetical protein [Acetobacter lovaniensis]MCP1239881.1 hypothetical protein [Acetobacter lovaniensis]NHN81985.1 hypothetical protein [Acetobacter lovaniensis]GBQ72009.1 hypothetical protein AA0474_2605 [Acetobacter lovaniensis NRIC 0474]
MKTDYRNDPRMPVVRRFIWKEVLMDTKNGLPEDEYYWIVAEGLLRSIDSGEVVPLPNVGGQS